MKKKDNMCEFEFSSPEKKKLLVSLVNVRAEAQNKSGAELIEEVLEKTLLPTHPQAVFLTERLFYANSLATGYQRVFQYYAAGIDLKARALGGKPLVEEFHSFLLRSSECVPIIGHEGDLAYLHKRLDSVAEYVFEKSSHQSFLLSDMVVQLKRYPERIMLANIVGQILDWWMYLENKTITYRALGAIAEISADWVRANARDVCTFLDTMERVSGQWPEI